MDTHDVLDVHRSMAYNNKHNSKMKDFVQKFVDWYVDSHAMPDAVSHMKLIELVREAELILQDKPLKKH